MEEFITGEHPIYGEWRGRKLETTCGCEVVVLLDIPQCLVLEACEEHKGTHCFTMKLASVEAKGVTVKI
jgi:hypothetical protein